MNKLEAVNWLLEHVGTEGVAVLPATHPQAVAAEKKLDLATERLLTEGWWFNTNYEGYYEADITDTGIIEGTYKTLNEVFRDKNIRKQGNKLVDSMTGQTKLISESMYEQQIILLPWDMLPIQAQSVILYMTAIDFVRSELEDEAKVTALSETMKGFITSLGDQQKENLRVKVTSSSYLKAINFVMNMLGRENVYSEESSDPIAMRVKERLDWNSEEVQSDLWWFNVKKNVYLTEVDNIIQEDLPVLSVIPVENKYVLQGNKFTNVELGEDVPASEVLCELVSYKLPWGRLPKVVQGLLRVQTALDLLITDMNHTGTEKPYENDQAKVQPLTYLKRDLEIRMREEDLRQRRLNMKNSTRVKSVLSRIRPWRRPG